MRAPDTGNDRAQMEKSAPKRTYEETVALVREQIRRCSDPEDRAELENVLREFESHEAKAIELRAKMSQLKTRYERLADSSLAPAVPWIIGLAAVLIIGTILARHYLQ